jgi:type IX secretion system PorP/SprF family membrane protein
MKRFYIIFLVSFLVTFHGWSQQLPLYTQYIFDPYLINPSMVGHSGRPEVNLLYRRQWTEIQDGPKTLQFDAQLPLNKKISLGLNLYNDKTVLLSATSVLMTFGYKVQLATEHKLGFGISGGIFSNHFRVDDVSALDANDPALLNGASNNLAANGQFGVNYSFKNFVLGFSMVNLFDRKTISNEKFQEVKIGQLKDHIFFTSYKFTLVPETWFMQANLAYRISQDNLNYLEGSALVSYKSIVDIGGGYRQNFGPSVILRLHLKRLHAGFSYDFPSNNQQVSTGGSQEMQLKWLFGDEIRVIADNSDSKPEETVEQQQQKPEPNTEEIKTEEPKIVEEKAPINPIQEQTVETKVAEQKVEDNVPIERVEISKQPEPKHLYYVIGTYKSRANAEKFLGQVKRRGVQAEIKESKSGTTPHYFYVHIPQYKMTQVSLDDILQLQEETGFKDAWFTEIDE